MPYLIGGPNCAQSMTRGKERGCRRNTLLERMPSGTKIALGMVKDPLNVEFPLQGGG